MEEVVVSTLSSSSLFNSKQWPVQQHDLLLTQQRQQLEQLKKEQEELKSRLRRYGKVNSTSNAQISTRYTPVTLPGPHQPVATPTKSTNSSSLLLKENKLSKELLMKTSSETGIEKPVITLKASIVKTKTSETSVISVKEAENNGPSSLSDTESISSVEMVVDPQEVTATAVSHATIPSSYDERPIKPLQASNYEDVLDHHKWFEDNISETVLSKGPVKKTFLRKGEGIARFGMKKLQLKKKRFVPSANTPAADSELALGDKVGAVTAPAYTPTSTQAAFATITSQAGRQHCKNFQDQQSLVRFPSDDSFVVRQHKHCKKEVEDLEEFELLEKAAENCSFSSQSSLVLKAVGKPVQTKMPPTTPEQVSSAESSDEVSEDETSLNDTLQAATPSIAFDDEEAWESCSQSSVSTDNDSNKLVSSVEDLGHPLVASTPPIKTKLISSNSEHNSKLQVLTQQPIKPDSCVQMVSTNKDILENSLKEVDVVNAYSKGLQLSQGTIIPDLPSPPTSNLMKKLFPLLGTEKHAITTTASIADKERESLRIVNLKEELETKRCQLEIEIDRFKRENAAINKLRLEREENLGKLRLEICDFQKQRTTEMEQFEEYKREEIKKLKKERKVFETYQKQLLPKPNRKEREEIEALRDELRQTQEEMKSKESRWGATLSRYRLRIEMLETQNKELQNDLHMMEQERLKQWQLQFNERKKLSSKACQVDICSKPDVSSIACQVNTLHDLLEPVTLPASNVQSVTSFGEKDSVDSSIVSEEEDIITVVTTDRISASMLHADSSSISDDGEQVFTPLCSPSKVNNQITKKSVALPHTGTDVDMTSSRIDGSKKSVRFQDWSRDILTDNVVQSNPDEITTPGKAVVIDEDGSQVITFSNGTRKVVNTDGSVSMYFFNGDSKQIKPDNTVIYYYSESDATHTTFPDGLEMFHFPNNQVEKHYPDGRKEVTFSDGTIKYLHANGAEECYFEDGTIQKVQPNGNHTIEFPNGQKEVHTKDFKCREYPDGTVKTVYPDGHQETRYSSGRVRIKDKNGRLIVDKVDVTKKQK